MMMIALTKDFKVTRRACDEWHLCHSFAPILGCFTSHLPFACAILHAFYAIFYFVASLVLPLCFLLVFVVFVHILGWFHGKRRWGVSLRLLHASQWRIKKSQSGESGGFEVNEGSKWGWSLKKGLRGLFAWRGLATEPSGRFSQRGPLGKLRSTSWNAWWKRTALAVIGWS